MNPLSRPIVCSQKPQQENSCRQIWLGIDPAPAKKQGLDRSTERVWTADCVYVQSIGLRTVHSAQSDSSLSIERPCGAQITTFFHRKLPSSARRDSPRGPLGRRSASLAGGVGTQHTTHTGSQQRAPSSQQQQQKQQQQQAVHAVRL
jgi:hypothetical protein